MVLREKLSKAVDEVKAKWWLLLVPLIIDLASILTYKCIYKKPYSIPPDKIFIWKIGVTSAPPSAQYIFENFPLVPVSLNTAYGSFSIFNDFSPFSIFLLMTFVLVLSFLDSAYMSVLAVNGEKTSLGDFFMLGNKNWHKYLVLRVVFTFLGMLSIFNRGFMFLGLLMSIVLYYVQYSMAVDDVSLSQNFSNGITVLSHNPGTTVKMAFFFGFVYTIISPAFFLLGRLGMYGILIAILVIDALGLAINKAVIEIYREFITKE